MLMIKNATILCCDSRNTIARGGYLSVQDGVIQSMGSGTPAVAEEEKAEQVIDAHEALLTPGFVNAHTHIPMTLFRDLGENMAGKDVLFKLFFPIEKQFVNPEFVYDGARLGCLELLKGGITCFADMYYFEDQVAEATKNVGLRAVLGESIANFATPDAPKPYGGLDYARKFVQQFRDDNLITPAYAPHAPYTVAKEILQEINDCAKQDGVPVLTHLAEMKDEAELMEHHLAAKLHGLSPVKYLSEHDLLQPSWLAAHCINLDKQDQELVRQSGLRISHNPLSNLKGEQGVAPMPELGELGVTIGLGTDSALGGNAQHLFTAMSYAYYLQRHRLNDYRAISAADILHWATLGGASALGLERQTGSLELGKQADMILWRKNSPALYEPLDIPAALVLACGPQDIDSVWVAGKQKLKDGSLLHPEQEQIFNKARKWRRQIREFCFANQILS